MYDVISFANSELNKYLDKLGVSANIQLGLFEKFGKDISVENPIYDDAIVISVKNKSGYVAGSNERSILMGVYRLLEEWGICWVRPGKNGAFIPSKCDAHDIEITEKAANRHRTVCIEGAVSIENVLDMIDWLPKVGFNGYFIQFDDAFTFFDRWYSHANSTSKVPELFDREKSMEYVKTASYEAKKRGLMLHRMGHCWTSHPFGIIDNGWEETPPEQIPDAYRRLCATVNGKRDVWKNQPLRTQLCYSTKKVRDTISEYVIDYLKKNPETDVIHFWLGDDFNNYCECDNCMKKTVSDHYIALINEITQKLENEGIKKLVVFNCGYNAAYPPTTEKLQRTEQTALIFAPISRTFSQSFPNKFRTSEATPFLHNRFTNPRSVDENLAYLCEWEKYYKGDIADFDYHLMWDHILDAGGEGIARVIYDDIRNFGNLGLNGYISCQLQRNSFPTSIAMTVMGKTLWDNGADFDKIKNKLYSACFGENIADKMCDYFSTLSSGFDIGCIRSQKPYVKEDFIQKLETAINAMRKMKNEAMRHTDEPNLCRKECWHLVKLNAELYEIVGNAILIRIGGDIEKSQAIIKTAAHLAWEKEDELQGALDCFFFEKMTRTRITPEKAIAFKDA